MAAPSIAPNPDKRGYVLNVFVQPAYRRRGLASALMQAADAEFARRGITFAVLHATRRANRSTSRPVGLAPRKWPNPLLESGRFRLKAAGEDYLQKRAQITRTGDGNYTLHDCSGYLHFENLLVSQS